MPVRSKIKRSKKKFALERYRDGGVGKCCDTWDLPEGGGGARGEALGHVPPPRPPLPRDPLPLTHHLYLSVISFGIVTELGRPYSLTLRYRILFYSISSELLSFASHSNRASFPWPVIIFLWTSAVWSAMLFVYLFKFFPWVFEFKMLI